jgi:hypothetical protein
MDWIDIASIIFVCVTMNHLGLISKIEEITGKVLPIINCPKCGSFWLSLIFLLGKSEEIMGKFPMILAISFLASYSALWLELLEGFIDTLYMKLYDKIYETSDDTPAADPDGGHSAGSVS